MLQQTDQSIIADSPFRLGDIAAYLQWREQRQHYSQPALNDLLVQIKDPYQLSDDEKAAIAERCKNFNMTVCLSVV